MSRSQLTIFAVPKPFREKMEMIQRNAIISWTMLDPRPDIILLGIEHGTAEIARELGAFHIPEIATSEFGTPLINSIFEAAETKATTPWLAYINSDCILLNDFSDTLSRLEIELGHHAISSFLLSSQRIEMDIRESIPFHDIEWQKILMNDTIQKGVLDYKTAIELFLFNRGFFTSIPPFSIGRPCWDNWVVWYAWKGQAAIIDATESFQIIHQCHDYTHVKGGWQEAWKGEEARRNISLAEGKFMSLDIACTHVLGSAGLIRGRSPEKANRTALITRRINQGLDEFNQGHYREALDYIEDALSRSGPIKTESLHHIRALCLLRLEKHKDAKEAIEEELRSWPDNERANNMLQLLKRKLGE